MLPKIIHFVWIGPAMPRWGKRNIEEFKRLNPGYKVMVHDMKILDGDLAKLAERLGHPSSQADLARLAALWKIGGWYFDLDTWPLRPLADAELAWGLDGTKVFISRQHNKVPVNNCMIACGPRAPGLRDIIDAALTTAPAARTTYGPDLVSRVVARSPANFVLSSWPWFMPVRGEAAARYYRRALSGNADALRHVTDGTGGQLPFALHLWLNGFAEEIERAFDSPIETPVYAYAESCPVDHMISGIARGLEALGIPVKRYNKDDEQILDRAFDQPAVLVAWNNIRRHKLAASAARRGVPVLWCENGFFERKVYGQVDHAGFLHWASWRRDLRLPSPPEGAARLARFYPEGIQRCSPDRQGCILVVGQVPRDTQMCESEIQGPIELQNAVKSALVEMNVGQDCYFRPHPQFPQPVRADLKRKLLPEMPSEETAAVQRAEYAAHKRGKGLAEALAQAQFVITINSTAANEALAAGVPVLAFGPHLGITAGVIRQTSLATIKDDIAAMMQGWRPDHNAVVNYLRWLAARQYSASELSQPETIGPLLNAAGVQIPAKVAEEAVA